MLMEPPSTGSDRTVGALRALIADGCYGPGDRLPPERRLIAELGVTRNTLRKALDALEREGAIWRHVGKGTFVARDAECATVGGFLDLGRQLTPVKTMRARLCLEPAIAREAAINASTEAIIRVRIARERAREATNWKLYEEQDDRFHRAVAEAADNLLLLSLFDRLNEVRRAVAFGTVVRQTERPDANHPSFAEHDAIAAAIEARDPAAAQETMRRHIGSVSARLFGEV